MSFLGGRRTNWLARWSKGARVFRRTMDDIKQRCCMDGDRRLQLEAGREGRGIFYGSRDWAAEDGDWTSEKQAKSQAKTAAQCGVKQQADETSRLAKQRTGSTYLFDGSDSIRGKRKD
ncbi:hypothetical protein TWF569_011981 [Orbilia oligospora]|uniref:Uncharacterized protein n=1 Tax=Orbilia oligospora TaxID=2813651 RepID=A0A7C8KDC8_ORBOL|nr:hypothetical protein TWF706_012009 [Orbilia oligospora]KAF3101545.1 hypothetical protein TWF102_012007 [Orbilia oligospora]KAF3105582.1 hypothetical protein TWF103_012015 [Orbilia oligospora]KAF3125558.1 hypothetical protein TWF594_001550 [Orbilia oligospora]KAF3134820.1 hypothetical protein TWF569_011981 [Orbilia oligospora]